MLLGPAFEEFRELGVIAGADHDLQRDVLVAGHLFALPLAMNALPRRRSRAPVSEPFGIVIVTGPVTVGTGTRAPSTASEG